MKTWEVKQETASNGLIQTNVLAHEFVVNPEGVTFYKGEEREVVAFFPLARLLGVKDVTP